MKDRLEFSLSKLVFSHSSTGICPMSSDARNFCAVHQLRDPVGEGGNGGLGITSVETISCAAFYAATMRGFAADCLGNFRQHTSLRQTMPYISAMLASASNHFVANGATLVKDDIEATSHVKMGYLYRSWNLHRWER